MPTIFGELSRLSFTTQELLCNMHIRSHINLAQFRYKTHQPSTGLFVRCVKGDRRLITSDSSNVRCHYSIKSTSMGLMRESPLALTELASMEILQRHSVHILLVYRGLSTIPDR